jgi:hypothetical protein
MSAAPWFVPFKVFLRSCTVFSLDPIITGVAPTNSFFLAIALWKGPPDTYRFTSLAQPARPPHSGCFIPTPPA